MAEDINLGTGINASEYARVIETGQLQVRGTIYDSNYRDAGWSENHFDPSQFRNLARYMLALADEAEREDSRVSELAADLQMIDATADDNYAVDLAMALLQKGYHK